MAKPRKNMSSFSSDIAHHFFKVYLPSLSSHNLKIPTTFVQKINGVVPGRSILRDPLGRLWHVEVEKVEDAFYFQTGWPEFVKSNCLKVGEFLVFRFMGDSVFDVMIFDNSGCEKDDNLDTMNINKVTLFVKEEPKSEDIGEDKYWEEEEEEHGKQVCEAKSSAAANNDEEYEFSNAAAAFDEPKHPYFIASVKMNRPYYLHIPKLVVTENDITMKPEMILLDPNQKSWPVRVCFRKDGRIIFTKGWWAFWRGNNLTQHDKCIFEFKQNKGRGRKSNVIKVNIIRATSTGEVSLVPRGGR